MEQGCIECQKTYLYQDATPIQHNLKSKSGPKIHWFSITSMVMSTVKFRTLSTSKYWNKTPMEFKAQPQIFKHLQYRL